jgi:hypothetical protein
MDGFELPVKSAFIVTFQLIAVLELPAKVRKGGDHVSELPLINRVVFHKANQPVFDVWL